MDEKITKLTMPKVCYPIAARKSKKNEN